MIGPKPSGIHQKSVRRKTAQGRNFLVEPGASNIIIPASAHGTQGIEHIRQIMDNIRIITPLNVGWLSMEITCAIMGGF